MHICNFFCTFAAQIENTTTMSFLKQWYPHPDQKELYERVKDDVERRARLAVLGPSDELFMGACHGIWAEMRRIFEEEYGIEWKSPSQMNPGVMFD